MRRSARLGPLRFHFTASGLSSISVGGRGASLNLPVNRRGGTRMTLGLPGTGLSWSVEQPEPAPPRRIDRRREADRLPAAPVAMRPAADHEGAAGPATGSDRPIRNQPDNDASAQVAAAADTGVAPGLSPTKAPLPNSRRLRTRQLQTLRQHCLQLFEQQLFRPGSEALMLWEEALVSRLLCDPALGGRLAGLLALVETRQALTAYLERARSQDDLKRRCQRCLTATETALRLCGQRGWLAGAG